MLSQTDLHQISQCHVGRNHCRYLPKLLNYCWKINLCCRRAALGLGFGWLEIGLETKSVSPPTTPSLYVKVAKYHLVLCKTAQETTPSHRKSI